MSHDPEKPAGKIPAKSEGQASTPESSAEGTAKIAKSSPKPEGLNPPDAKAQTLVNLKAWMPFLQNPSERARLIRYAAREARDTGTWRIALPVQCWKCQTKDGIKPRKMTRSVRCFENAIPIAVAGTTFTLIQFLLSLVMLIWGNFGWSGTFAFTGGLTALVAGGLLWLKSWEEEVKFTLHTCSTCEWEMRGPDIATDQEELHLFLPTAELTVAAQAEQKAERRSKGKSGAAEPGGDEAGGDKPKKKKAKVEGGEGPAPAAKSHAAPDLPPISLEDAPKGTATPIKAKVKVVPKPAPPPPADDLPPIKMDD